MMRCYTRRDLLRATYRNMYKKNAVRYNSIYYIRESKFIRPTLCSVIFFPCKSVDHFPNVNCVRLLISFIMFQCYTSVYPKVSGLAAWSGNCKWYGSLVSQSGDFFRHNPLCCFSTNVVCFFIDSVRKLLDTPSYSCFARCSLRKFCTY